MKLVTSEKFLGYPSYTVHGVELEGLTDAAKLADNLGVFALGALEDSRSHLQGLEFQRLEFGTERDEPTVYGYMFGPSRETLAAEALTLQSQLLKQLASGAISDGIFSFRAVDNHAGGVLKKAVELPEKKVALATVRPQWRFPESSLHEDIGRIIKNSRSGIDLEPLHEDKYNEDIISIPRSRYENILDLELFITPDKPVFRDKL